MGRLGIHSMICDDGAIGSVRGVRLPNVSVVTLDYLIEIGQGLLGSFVLGSAFSAQLRVAVLEYPGPHDVPSLSALGHHCRSLDGSVKRLMDRLP